MDVNGIAAQSVANTATRIGDAVTMNVLNKTLDAQVQQAAGLLGALPEPVKAPDPDSKVGHNINTTA